MTIDQMLKSILNGASIDNVVDEAAAERGVHAKGVMSQKQLRQLITNGKARGLMKQSRNFLIAAAKLGCPESTEALKHVDMAMDVLKDVCESEDGSNTGIVEAGPIKRYLKWRKKAYEKLKARKKRLASGTGTQQDHTDRNKDIAGVMAGSAAFGAYSGTRKAGRSVPQSLGNAAGAGLAAYGVTRGIHKVLRRNKKK